MGLVLDEAEDDVDARRAPGRAPSCRLASSSKRALISTRAVTFLPFSAASIRAATIGLSLRGAVERLLDRQHVGVARGLAQELHHHVEALERVVDQDVLLADGGEAVAAVVADALGEARLEGLELQVRPVRRDQLGQLRPGPACRRPGSTSCGSASSSRTMKARRSSGMEASILMRTTEPRRRCFSSASNSRTRSSASSSISTSLSRIRRKTPCASARRSRGTGGRGTASAGSPAQMNALAALRRAAVGRPAARSASPGSAPAPGRRARGRRERRCSFSASEKPRLGMNGKGCAGSMASGVSTGNSCVQERAAPAARARSSVTSSASTTAMPSAASSSRSSRQRRLLVGHQVGGGGVDLRPAARRASGRPG